MTLPSSGPLSFSAINTELGRSSTTLITLKNASDGAYATINRNSTAGYNIWYNSVVNGNNYSTNLFHDYNHAANILIDYNFSNTSTFDVFDINIDFGTGNNIAYVGMLPANTGNEVQVNVDTTKSGNGWYVYFANNPVSKGTLVDIYLYDVNTGDSLYSISADPAINYTGQSIGPTSNYYRHLGLNLTFSDP